MLSLLPGECKILLGEFKVLVGQITFMLGCLGLSFALDNFHLVLSSLAFKLALKILDFRLEESVNTLGLSGRRRLL
jgi:hypothetical protein